jgi:pimeloyl-ACP methyl ester carboxylesterase
MPATSATLVALLGVTATLASARPPASPILPTPLSGPVSWATTAAPNPDPAHAAARVFLLRGTGMVFSPEFGTLCTRLRQAGVWAEDLPSGGDSWVCQRVHAERRAGRPAGPIVLIGHSRGGRHALHAARELEKSGIGVDLLVCLDVAVPPEVPANVRRALNLYMTRNRLYPAGTLTTAPGSRTRIENIDLSEPGTLLNAQSLHHLNITANPTVQDLVVQRVLEVVHESAH